MKKYRNKYRIPSARLPHWDYGQPALYFVTICTHKRIPYFGEIDKSFPVVETPCMASLQRGSSKIRLSEIGQIVEYEWMKTCQLRRDMNLYMGEFVIMPDHFHAIIGIGDNSYNSFVDPIRCRDAMHGVSTTGVQNIPAGASINQFGPQSKNLASIIRGFKSAVTIGARKIQADFEWQPRFHDHIIRNDNEHRNISRYILQNPFKSIS
jgi:putative transposase